MATKKSIPILIDIPLEQAIEQKNWIEVMRLLDRENDDGCGYSSRNRSRKMTSLLHRLYHIPPNERNEAPLTLIDRIIESYPNLIWFRDDDGRSALHFACSYTLWPSDEFTENRTEQDTPTLRLEHLLRAFSVDNQKPTIFESNGYLEFLSDAYSITPLQMLVSSRPHDCFTVPMLKALLEVFPTLSSTYNLCQVTPLHYYTTGTLYSREILQCLLDSCICNDAASKVDIYGRTPLHVVVATSPNFKNSKEEIRLLAQAYPDAVYLKDRNGKDSFMYAWENFLRRCVKGDEGQVILNSQSIDDLDFKNVLEILREGGKFASNLPKNCEYYDFEQYFRC